VQIRSCNADGVLDTYVPCAQVDQLPHALALVAALKRPELQAAQLRSVVAVPWAVTYSPATHSRNAVHEVWSAAVEKLPAAQGKQTWSAVAEPAVPT